MDLNSFLTQLFFTFLPGIVYAVWRIGRKFKLSAKRKRFEKENAIRTSVLETPSSVTPSQPTRFRIALDLLKSGTSVSEIAEACGIEYENLVEKYVSGETEAPLSFKNKFCELYNINPAWLIHGGEAPFSHLQNRSFHEAHEAASFISEFQPSKIYFVKTKSDRAPFCIILEKDKHSYSIIHNDGNWLISDKTGRGGQMQTTSLYVLLKWLNSGSFVELSGGNRQKRTFGIRNFYRGVELESDREFYCMSSNES